MCFPGAGSVSASCLFDWEQQGLRMNPETALAGLARVKLAAAWLLVLRGQALLGPSSDN